MINAYAKEKQHWIEVFSKKHNQDKLQIHRQVRNDAVQAKHQSDLQARMWKLALEDAAHTWHTYWSSILKPLRGWVFSRKDFSDEDKHYLFWVMAGYPQFFASLKAVPLPAFDLDVARCQRLCIHLLRKIKKINKTEPVVKKARSAVFDKNCYSVFEENNTLPQWHQHYAACLCKCLKA